MSSHITPDEYSFPQSYTHCKISFFETDLIQTQHHWHCFEIFILPNLSNLSSYYHQSIHVELIMNNFFYPHNHSFLNLSRHAMSSSQSANQAAAAPAISSIVSFPRSSSIIPLAQNARAKSQRVARAISAPASSKKRTFREFALGEEIEVAREGVEMVDA